MEVDEDKKKEEEMINTKTTVAFKEEKGVKI